MAGWRGYEYWQAQQAARDGTAFEEAVILSEQGKPDEARAAFAKLAAEGTPAYRALSKLREAAEVAKSDPKAAVAIYDAVGSDTTAGPLLRDVAALRAGYLLADEAGLDDLVRRLEPLTGADRAFRHSARLVLALAAWRTGDIPASRRWAEMAMGDPEAPQTTRGQAEMLLSLTASGEKS